MHVDEFIDRPGGDRATRYARFCLMLMRLPAHGVEFAEFTKDFRLYCTHEGRRWRVTMASRMGDIGLSPVLVGDSSYKKRVSVDECFDWGDTPEGMKA